MTEMLPTRAYDLLTDVERQAVDEYMAYLMTSQRAAGERIAPAINYPIPQEFIRRSRGILAKPLPRAALAERITEEAREQDLAPDRIIKEHSIIAFSNITDFFEQRPFGDTALKDFSTLPPDKLGAVKSIRTKPTLNGMHTEITLHDKRESLAVLTKLTGLVAPDAPPILETYSNSQADEQRKLDAPESIYAEMLEGR